MTLPLTTKHCYQLHSCSLDPATRWLTCMCTPAWGYVSFWSCSHVTCLVAVLGVCPPSPHPRCSSPRAPGRVSLGARAHCYQRTLRQHPPSPVCSHQGPRSVDGDKRTLRHKTQPLGMETWDKTAKAPGPSTSAYHPPCPALPQRAVQEPSPKGTHPPEGPSPPLTARIRF